MRFKIKQADRPKHTELVAGVAWSNTNDLFSVGDDNQILKWDILGDHVSVCFLFAYSVKCLVSHQI